MQKTRNLIAATLVMSCMTAICDDSVLHDIARALEMKDAKAVVNQKSRHAEIVNSATSLKDENRSLRIQLEETKKQLERYITQVEDTARLEGQYHRRVVNLEAQYEATRQQLKREKEKNVGLASLEADYERLWRELQQEKEKNAKLTGKKKNPKQ